MAKDTKERILTAAPEMFSQKGSEGTGRRRIHPCRKGKIKNEKSTCFNMTKSGYTVHVFSDCVISYELKKLPEMLAFYKSKG